MAEVRYHGKIDHTEKTIQQLYKTQYYAFEKRAILLRLALGLVLVGLAVFLSIPTWSKAILLLIGTWFLVSGDFRASVRADRALSERKADLPSMQYDFGEKAVRLTGEGTMDIPYEKFARLSEDGQYLYLFVSKNSVCMVERSSIEPETDTEFMEFIAEKTSLSWQTEKNFLSMSIYDIKALFKDLKHR